MTTRRICGRRIETSLVWLAGSHRLSHLVVHLQDHALGAVLAVRRLVLAPYDGERVHDVVDIVALDAVEVEERRVELGSEEKPPLRVPAERRPVVPEVTSERGEVVGSERKFEDARGDPLDVGAVGERSPARSCAGEVIGSCLNV